MVRCLQVDNRTFPCYYPGQELQIRLIAQGWLHVGSISCPSCEEICLVTSFCFPTFGFIFYLNEFLIFYLLEFNLIKFFLFCLGDI